MPRFKEASVGLFIRDSLVFDKRPPKRMYIYELWKLYNDSRTKTGMKGMKYKPFNNYIWVLKTLKLLKTSPAPRGQKFKPNVSPLSEMVPDDWIKSYVQLNYEKIEDRHDIINHPAWINPFKYYRISIGSEKFFSTEKTKQEWRQHKLVEKWNVTFPLNKITELDAYNRYDELINILNSTIRSNKAKYPSTEETTLIRISISLKNKIDILRGKQSVNSYLVQLFTEHGLYP